MRTCIQRKERGDTLIEVVMATAIMTVLLVTAYNVANLAFRVGVQARERTEAIHVVQSQAERLRAWRDQLVQGIDPATGQQSDSSKRFFSVNDFGPCSASGCRVEANGTGYKAVPAGSADANNLYTITVVPPASFSPSATFKITAQWESATSTQPNTSSIDFTLADTTGLTPRDCSALPSSCGVRP